MNMHELKSEYDNLAAKYIRAFEIRHSVEFDFWVCGMVGGDASFNKYYRLSYEDIRRDIDSGSPRGLILEYLNYYYKHNSKVTFNDYCRGVR